jgi:alkanesulfonate monooxygenase SsuD/methylene tetrahydromethanopterin reductase-like flavin-dependent oxidoreductase (luciferase family)
MWSDDNGPFNGRHYQLAETLCVPQPISRPHPPILVGGGGEKKTLLLVARYADACNLFGSSPADVGAKLEVLRSHCEAEGRDYDRIEKTVLAVRPALADVDGFLAAAREYAALGVTELEVMPDRHPVEFTTQFAERVLPGLADL